jgi:hypothetical protein
VSTVGFVSQCLQKSLIFFSRFRYAQCQLDYLVTLRTTRMVKQALYNLPSDINAVYETILSNIPEPDRVLARESLFLVAGALRPLTILELAEAVVVERRDTHIDDEIRLLDPEVLLEICQGLIEYDKASNVVTLAHSSIRSFLTSCSIDKSKASWYGYNLSGIHADVADKCLTYLLFDHFRGGYCRNGDLAKDFNDFPFLRYASQYWPLHARLCTEPIYFDVTAMKFCLSHALPNGGNFSFWAQCLMPDASEERIRATKPLYYAASFGLTDLTKSLLTSKCINIEAPGGRHKSSALHVACYRGHVDIARHLLECGADVNAADGDGVTPLFWAEKMGRSEIIDLLQDPKFACSNGRKVLALSTGPEYGDYPMWFCCHCNVGPQRGRFIRCWECRHGRCEKCLKMAGMEDSEMSPEVKSRWMCCSCESGPNKVEADECQDCEHKKCRRCWVFDISMSGN